MVATSGNVVALYGIRDDYYTCSLEYNSSKQCLLSPTAVLQTIKITIHQKITYTDTGPKCY